jgi:gamma-glutamyltranspeptidase/glutathione hydrolase
MIAADRLRQSVLVTGPKVVTSAHPAATAAGVAAFAEGGNAFDAALAACFMETVVLPMKCGLAGDLVSLYRRAGGRFESILSIGPGPRALNQGESMERLGPRSVGIPGAPAGYAALSAFGRLGVDRLVAPAVRAAEEGVAWTWVALSYLIEAEELLARFSPNHPYSPGGRRPKVGEVRRLPGLGRLLLRFAERGADLFVAEDGDFLISELRARGGILSRADLQDAVARNPIPASTVLPGDSRLIVTPAPTDGSRLAEVVARALETGGSLPGIVRAERVEAKRRGRLASDDGTSVVTAGDEEGNIVVVVHSNSFPRFGSGVVLVSGLVLNNRPGRGFDLDAPPGARNAPAAGREPQTTLHAWALEREGELFVGATPGGVNQLPWNAQAIGDLLAGAAIGEAVTNPRWALDEKGELTAEAGTCLPEGTPARRLDRFSHRSVQQIIRVAGQELLSAAADPRCGACALAVY